MCVPSFPFLASEISPPNFDERCTTEIPDHRVFNGVVSAGHPFIELCPKDQTFNNALERFLARCALVRGEIERTSERDFSILIGEYENKLGELRPIHMTELESGLCGKCETLKEGSRLIESLFRAVEKDLEQISIFWRMQTRAVELQLESACRMQHEEAFENLQEKMNRCHQIWKQELQERLVLAETDAQTRWKTMQRFIGNFLERWNGKELARTRSMEECVTNDHRYQRQSFPSSPWDPWGLDALDDMFI